MQSVIIILYVAVSLLLVLVIMLQPGKGSGLGAIGGGGGGSMFGARGAVGFLGKLTGWLAAIFMVLALVLARLSLDTGSIAPTSKAAPTGEFGGAATSSSLPVEDEPTGDKAAVTAPDTAKPAEGAKADEAAAPAGEPKAAEPKAAEPKAEGATPPESGAAGEPAPQ